MINQHDYVRGVLAYYAENDIRIGDPEEGKWEEAHYPLPRDLGDETVTLLHEHHQVQGILQSVELSMRCFFTPDARKALVNSWAPNWFELWDAYDQANHWFSEEQRIKMREAQLGQKRKFSEEHRANLSRAATGRLMSDEAKAKMSVKAKARSDASTAQPMIEANKGKKHSTQRKANVSAGNQRNWAERSKNGPVCWWHLPGQNSRRLCAERPGPEWEKGRGLLPASKSSPDSVA